MREDKNIWSKQFNDPNLEDEEWLTPSPEVLENIARDLFEDKKEKKIPIWVWLTLLLITVGTLVVLSASTLGQTNDIIKEDRLNNRIELDEIDETITPIDLAQKQPSKLVTDSETTSGSIADSSASQLTQQESVAVQTKKRISTNQIKATVDRGVKSAVENNSDILNAETQIIEPTASRQIIAYPSEIESILISEILNTNSFRASDIIFDELSQPIIQTKDKPKRSSFNIASGVSFWQFELNETYENVLQPADFSYTNASGFNISMQYNFNIAKNLDIMAFAGFEKIEFDSGHNSSLQYKLNNEEEDINQNTFDLDMASPLGFLQSEVIIQRSAQAQTAATDIVVDLNNHHTIKNINLGLGLLQRLNINSNFNAEVGISASINRIFGIENSLDYVGIDINGFETINQTVTQGQESINEIIPSVGYQLGLSYGLTSNISLGLNWTSSFSVTPIYQESDFSTRFNRHLAQMNLQYHF